MLISYNWLQTYFDTPLPAPEAVADALTFHSSEIEGVETVGDDTIFDVKVLPDKSAWLLSHRGVAKELSVIFDIPLVRDPLAQELPELPVETNITVVLDTDTCDYYSATLIENIKVGPSPDWLRTKLEVVGQKSINNVVDVTNYVMLSLGQPLHAFDAETLKKADGYAVGVRQARDGEGFTSLTGEVYELTSEDAVIIDGNDTVLALAGVKGGLHSGITEVTTSIVLEAAHFERVAVRRTATRHRLQTDASKRYENGISRAVVPYAVQMATKLLGEVAGATVVGTKDAGECTINRTPVTVLLERVNSMLGTSLLLFDVSTIIDRFGFAYTARDNELTITPTFERDDLVLEADMIEEIGRVYGLDKIVSVPPVKREMVAINQRHYCAEVIRETLVALGFSEVYTSSFRKKDIVQVKNALASDKGFLRSSLAKNLDEARQRNVPYRDLLGLSAVKLFEIGTVFGVDDEDFEVGLAVQTGTEYKVKTDEKLWKEAVVKLEEALGVSFEVSEPISGVIAFSMNQVLKLLPVATAYAPRRVVAETTYQTFSIYPPVSRDIAMWVSEGMEVGEVEEALRASSGPLLVRLTHLDTFSKDGRTSLAFRLVFQSNEKTLDGSEVDTLMASVYQAVAKAGWEVR